MKHTKLQTEAVAYFKEHMIRGGTDKFPHEYKEYSEKIEHDGVIVIKGYVGVVGDEGTALILCRDNWMATISRRGKITAWGYPQSYDQFKGKKVFHIHIK